MGGRDRPGPTPFYDIVSHKCSSVFFYINTIVQLGNCMIIITLCAVLQCMEGGARG